MTEPRTAETELLKAWSRDLATCLAEEIPPRWSAPERSAIDKLDPLGFDGRLRDHSPLWFLASNIFFDNDPGLLHAPLHRDVVCREFEDYIYRDGAADSAGLLLLIQRDSFKSTFSHGVLPLGFTLRMKHLYGEDARILLCHHKEAQASANLQRLKQKASHPWMKLTWPEFAIEAGEDLGTKLAFNWPCKEVGRTAESSIMASGMGGRMTGYHFSLRINDDIVTEEHRDSKVMRDEAFDKYTAMRFLRDTRKSWEVNTGTPYHPNDLWSKLIRANVEGKPLYKSRLIAAIGDDDRLSFPNRHTYDYLEKIRQEEISRSGNDDYFQLQMLCRYRSTRMIAADWNWMKFCKQEDVPASTYRCILVDPAWKGTENSGEGDSAAIAVLALERRGALVFRYILDGCISNTMTDAEGKAAIFSLMRRYGVTDVGVEEFGGKSFKQSLRNEAQTRGVWINVLDDLKSQRTAKGQRITNFLAECQSGRVWLAEECDADFKEQFRDQLTDFPQLDHEDALDCVAYSCDPAISARIVPRWNDATIPHWQQEQEETAPRRTRYCGL